MADIILNEKKYVEEVILKSTPQDKIKLMDAVRLLAKYYHYVCGDNTETIIQKLSEYLRTHYSYYNELNWAKTLEVCANGAGKYPIVQIEYVSITEAEMSVVDSLPYPRLRRVAFTMLACAKYFNLISERNNGWVNRQDKEIFKMAHIQETIKKQCMLMHELYELGLIEFSHKVDNLNSRITFIDDTSPIALKLTDFRELGYEYMAYHGEKYKKCEKCGRLISSRSNSRKYCSDCAKYQPIGTKIIKCVDCGKEFEVDSRNMTKSRCDNCQKEYRKKWDRERKKKQ